MKSRRDWPRLLLFLIPFSALGAHEALTQENSTYAALRGARPQGRGIAVQNLVLERDVFRFRFDSGVFQLLPPIEQRIVGAVFVGEGSWELKPATEAERRHLAVLTGEKDLAALSDRFDSLVLLFTDETAVEIERQGSAVEAPARSITVYEAYLRKQRKDLKLNLQLRLLQDLLKASTDARSGVFFAYLQGKKLPSALVASDPSGLDWFSPHFQLGGENTALFVIDAPDAGFWYLAHRKDEIHSGQIVPFQPLADALHYEIETTVRRNADIQGTTTIRFQPLITGLRVLPIRLLPKLRIRKAEFSNAAAAAPWQQIPFIQEDMKEDSDAAVVFPSPLARGQTLKLRMTYEGNEVLRNVGEGNFVVDARESWYPNLGVFTDLATFDLIYRVPKANDVVSVGKAVEGRIEGEARVSHWKADHPIRVAGFNYGKFRRLERADKESGMRIAVYTNPGTPDIINEINEALRSLTGRSTQVGDSPVVPSDLDDPFSSSPQYVGPRSIQVSTEALAESALADGVNTARVCTTYFGPLPAPDVAISQQAQWIFGQSWPSLIFLPYMAFLDGTTRRELGLSEAADFVDQVGLHEFAHQWWGHLVGFESYRDQWLSEGFAEFSAALVLQHSGGLRKYRAFWEKARRQILERPRQSALSNDAAGPISQGWRISTRRSPSAYGAIVYLKGAFVLHMLRMLMFEPGTATPDAKFMAMMRDFATRYAGKNPSTRDFQEVVERHMVPAMNATLDGKMDWFFRQWVYGMEIPRYRAKLDLQKESGDQYRLTGLIGQEGVSDGFRTLLPIYVEFSKGELSRFGVVPLVGSQSVPVNVVIRLPKKPKRALVNAFHEVLARD